MSKNCAENSKVESVNYFASIVSTFVQLATTLSCSIPQQCQSGRVFVQLMNCSQIVDHHTEKTCVLLTQPLSRPIFMLTTTFSFGMTTTNQTSPTHPRAWRIKRSKPIPETTPTTPLTLIFSQRSENSRNKKVEGTKTVKFSFIERAKLPNGQVSESVISFNETSEYWKPGALDNKPWYILNCRTTR